MRCGLGGMLIELQIIDYTIKVPNSLITIFMNVVLYCNVMLLKIVQIYVILIYL